MPISIDTLKAAARNQSVEYSRSFSEANRVGIRTAFLCHSHHDADLAKGLVQLLTAAGWRVYIDWQDNKMPETPSRETADRIKRKIVDHAYFLFLATRNSMQSRWCPWEIGYADGKKQIDQILIVPTKDGIQTHGNEYLQLYRSVDLSDKNQLAVWAPEQSNNGVLVENL
jgi:hypothetical protein